MSLLIVTPVRKDCQVDARTAAWVIAQRRRHRFEWVFNANEPVDAARNNLVEFCQRTFTGWDMLFWLDADVVPPTDALDRLLAAEKSIVAGCYKLFIDGHEMWSFKESDEWCHEPDPQGPRRPITQTGAGCLLVHREVFERLPWPWFKFVHQPMDDTGAILKTGEDCYFCDQARAAGYELYVDPVVRCRHFNRREL